MLLVEEDGVRVLDDRSLNGVFVNGERVLSQMLADGDEIVIGRYRLILRSVRAMREPSRIQRCWYAESHRPRR